jgi:L,D-transpeptidase YcbB
MIRPLATGISAAIFVLFASGTISGHKTPHRVDWLAHSTAQTISTSGVAELRAIADEGALTGLLRPSFPQYRDEVREFYASFQYSLPWLRDSQPTPQARAILQYLEDAESKGLRPVDYDSSQWQNRLTELNSNRHPSESTLVRFDVAVTVATMRYLSDAHMGRVNPRLFHFGFDVDHNRYDLSQFLADKLVSASDVNAVLTSVEPPFPAYQRTLAALHTYFELARQDDGDLLPLPKKPVLPGGSYAGLSRLVRLLTLTGDVSSTSGMQVPVSVYQEPVVAALKRFQTRHGLDVTGQIDASTVKELNVPFRERVNQLQLVLERWRWLPHAFDRPPVVVNIPEFRLHVDDEQYHWIFSMPVVVGRAYRHQTPVFASEMTYVTFRPDWNVPLGIQRAEIVPELEKHPEHLVQKDYVIVDRTGNVATQDVSNPAILDQLRSGKLAIRQKPGPNNSLGLVKFGIPNEYDIYLHGTPATELFSRSRRDFSHGCIRVEDPAALAAWVFRDKPQWTLDRIHEAMDAERSLTVKLDKPIPVLILYGTAVVTEDGEVRFFQDIYGYDAELQKALAAQALD